MPHRLAPFQFLLQLSSNSFSTRTRLLFLFPPIRITRTINPSFSLFLGERARWKCRRIFGESVSSSLKNRNEALQLFFETRGAIDTRKRNCSSRREPGDVQVQRYRCVRSNRGVRESRGQSFSRRRIPWSIVYDESTF